MRRPGILLLMSWLVWGAHGTEKHRVLFNRFLIPDIGLFIADADGRMSARWCRMAKSSIHLTYPGRQMGGVHVRTRGAGRRLPGASGRVRAWNSSRAIQPSTIRARFRPTTRCSRSYRRAGRHGRHLAAGYREERVSQPDAPPLGQFPAELVAGRAMDRLQLRSRRKTGRISGSWEHLQSTGIYIVHPDGTGLRRLTRAGGFAGSPAWSADSRRVLYDETDEAGAYLAKRAQSRTEIAAIDITTGERTQYTASNETKLSPQWLPDGRLSYVVRSGDDKEGLKVWHPDRRVDAIVNGAVRHPSWLPAANRLCMSASCIPPTRNTWKPRPAAIRSLNWR